MTLRADDLTPALLDEIEDHQAWGNVQLLKVGRGGGEQNIAELRATLGHVARTAIVEAVETPKETAPGSMPSAEAPKASEPGKAADVGKSDGVAGEFIPYSETELLGLKKDDLIKIYQEVVDGPVTGKSKQTLAEEILAAQEK
jgi:hypothetical protein